MISKQIHYCWFGRNPVPISVKKCINSWYYYCPDYSITLWNEDNFDVFSHPYMEEAYKAKKWAFVSDLARLLIIYEHGGVYLDTDVELIASLDSVLHNTFFFAIEKDTNIRTNKESIHIATGLGFGAEPKNNIIKAMLDEYEGVHFNIPNGFDLTPCPVRNSRALKKYGWDGKDKILKVDNGTVYPSDYFCPEEYSSDIKRYSSNTISIHHYDSSWKSEKEKLITLMKTDIKKMLRLLWGKNRRNTMDG